MGNLSRYEKSNADNVPTNRNANEMPTSKPRFAEKSLDFLSTLFSISGQTHELNISFVIIH